MRKIIMAFDGKSINMPTFDFACYLGRLTRSTITGICLENLVADEKPVLKSMHGLKYLDWEIDETSPQYREKKRLIEQNISFFKEACERRSVRGVVHSDEGLPASEIAGESRFADVIILDAETTFRKKYEGAPTDFVKAALKDSECPVIISPESFDEVDEILFTYDGTASSVFAMKQFTYLFPEFSEKRVIVIQVNEAGEWESHDKSMLRSWLQNYYSAIGFEALKGKAKDQLFSHLFMRKNSFVVLGAYGRNGISRSFKHSRADRLIKTISQPIFISHI